jgi:prepilin-type N-terminal cleavage/methylation domain-containing protein
MHPPAQGSRGYSLIELLVVLVIVGVMAMVGASMLGSRPTGAVRSVMDEMEGTLIGASRFAVATGNDVLIATSGDWGGAQPMEAAYGAASLGVATILANATTNAFRVAVNSNGSLKREHMYAGVVTKATADWWGTAKTAAGMTDIESVPPFSVAATGFNGILTSATSPNLFLGSTNGTGSARISGATNRFTSSFWIEIVSLRNGQPVPGGPMGLLVVQGNGASVYKFYNPGIINGNGTWRRI